MGNCDGSLFILSVELNYGLFRLQFCARKNELIVSDLYFISIEVGHA